MKDLANVCLIAIDGVGDKTQQLDNVVNLCCSNFNFKCAIRLSPLYKNEKATAHNTTVYELNIPKLSYYDYNNFCIHGLYELVDNFKSEYCLIVQEDGFIINPELWEDSFYNFDYIGAPWIKYSTESKFPWVQHFGEKAAVGNGGFTFRSKRFLQACLDIPYPQNSANEDVYLCAVAGDYLRSKGIVFADIDTAGRFSLETKNDKYNDLSKVFGFHGKHLVDEAWELVKRKNK
jgi:hypothetical protein